MGPYRNGSSRASPEEKVRAQPSEWAHGELTIAAMLVVVGALCVGIDVVGSGGGPELPVGVVFLALGLRVLVGALRANRR